MKQLRKFWLAAVPLVALLIFSLLALQPAAGQGLVEYAIKVENDRFYVGGNVEIQILQAPGCHTAELDWGDESPIDSGTVPITFSHVYNAPGDFTLTLNCLDVDDNLLSSASAQITVEEPAETMAYLADQVDEGQADGLFTQWQADALKRELDIAQNRIEDERYVLAAFNLDRFAIAGLVITGPYEWEAPPDIAFDMADALRGWVGPPD